MNDLSNVIKRISKKCIDAYKPADVFLAKITSVDPVEAQRDAQRPIYSDTIICAKHITDLKVDDKVIILQDAGANVYYIIGVLP